MLWTFLSILCARTFSTHSCYYPGARFLRVILYIYFNFVGNCHTVFQSDHTIFYSNQQPIRVPLSFLAFPLFQQFWWKIISSVGDVGRVWDFSHFDLFTVVLISISYDIYYWAFFRVFICHTSLLWKGQFRYFAHF